ncbi:hypothetical protein PILCRDRAFT_636 [Piloderma croceum F 1598]|uniref:Uncharacterized protein n=1 Tax=Piloderma croceum (strain F 1598) TaxID=765440 RepID=A0A0C3CNY2_PILCF|nr:hypothetical protein PILCRDRAFT_636 [Piloderma croceum F 1598]
MTSYYISNKTANSTALAERIEQEIVYKNKCETSDTALAAQPGNCRHQSSNHSTKLCSNLICSNPIGHLGCDCWEKEGAMEGKRDEALAKCAKAHEEKNKKKIEKDVTPTSNTGPAVSGSDMTILAILLASAEDSVSPPVALAAFKNDPIYTSMSDADCFEYVTLFVDDHSASVNWHERRRMVLAGNCLVASMNTNAHTICRAGPFILDSRATIHILPDPSNFFELKAVPPE